MKKIFTVVFLLWCASVFSVSNKPDVEMLICIDKLNAEQTIGINIFTPDGQVVWNYYSQKTKGDTILTAKNWLLKPGIYKLSISIGQKNTITSKKDCFNFNIVGSEYEVISNISFKDSVGDLIYYSPYIRLIRKFYRSSDSVTLEEKWTPKSYGYPNYYIHNNSRRNIYGVRLGHYFFGWIEKFENGNWSDYERGVFTRQLPEVFPVYPKDSILSFEGYFSGRPVAFKKGKYKYCVEYAFDELRSIGIANTDIEPENRTAWNIYLLEKEFEITN